MSSSSNYEGGKYAKKARKQADPSNAPVPETNLGASAPVKEASSPPQVAEEAHVSPVGEAGASVPAPGPSDPPPPTATVADTTDAFNSLRVRVAVPTEGATAGGPLPSPRSQQQPHSPKKRKATGSISQGDIQQEEKLKRNTGAQGDISLARSAGPLVDLVEKFNHGMELNRDLLEAIKLTESHNSGRRGRTAAGSADLPATSDAMDRLAFEEAVAAAAALLQQHMGAAVGRGRLEAEQQDGEEGAGGGGAGARVHVPAQPAAGFLMSYALQAMAYFAEQGENSDQEEEDEDESEGGESEVDQEEIDLKEGGQQQQHSAADGSSCGAAAPNAAADGGRPATGSVSLGSPQPGVHPAAQQRWPSAAPSPDPVPRSSMEGAEAEEASPGPQRSSSYLPDVSCEAEEDALSEDVGMMALSLPAETSVRSGQGGEKGVQQELQPARPLMAVPVQEAMQQMSVQQDDLEAAAHAAPGQMLPGTMALQIGPAEGAPLLRQQQQQQGAAAAPRLAPRARHHRRASAPPAVVAKDGISAPPLLGKKTEPGQRRSPAASGEFSGSRLSNDPPKRQRKAPEASISLTLAPIADQDVEDTVGVGVAASPDRAGAGLQLDAASGGAPAARVSSAEGEAGSGRAASAGSSRPRSRATQRSGSGDENDRSSAGAGSSKCAPVRGAAVAGGGGERKVLGPSTWGSSLVCADLTVNDIASSSWPFLRAMQEGQQAPQLEADDGAAIGHMVTALDAAITAALEGAAGGRPSSKVKSLVAATAFDDLLRGRAAPPASPSVSAA